MYGCKLNRTHLERAVEIAAKGMSDKSRTLVSTTVRITKTRATSLDKILVELGDPERLANIVIDVDDDVEKESKSVYLSIDRTNVYIRISGTDETWVRGRFDELCEFFKNTRSRLGMEGEFAFYIPAALVMLTVVGSGVIGLIDNSSFVGIYTISISASIVIAICLGIFLRRQGVTVIDLAGSRRVPWSRGDIIAIVGVVVAVFALVVAVIQEWGH
jgi:hypothetical protein